MATLTPGDRLWLIESLTDLIERRGASTFLEARLLEPTPACFPDRWTADAAAVRTLARRLLAHAGLDLDAEVELFDDGPDEQPEGFGTGQTSHHAGTAAWFAGIDRGVCLFGAEIGKLRDGIGIVGAMAHEIAHAYRRFHRLEVRDRDEEERLTDLTTIYLGTGILTTNASYRYRASSSFERGGERSMYSHQRIGYLGPAAMSYLLAMQVVARGADVPEQKRVARLLETNQAGAFRATCASIERPSLAPLLGGTPLPPMMVTPAPSARDRARAAVRIALWAIALLGLATIGALALDALVG